MGDGMTTPCSDGFNKLRAMGHEFYGMSSNKLDASIKASLLPGFAFLPGMKSVVCTEDRCAVYSWVRSADIDKGLPGLAVLLRDSEGETDPKLVSIMPDENDVPCVGDKVTRELVSGWIRRYTKTLRTRIHAADRIPEGFI